LDLSLHKNPKIAAEHEEFVANANRRALEKHRIAILKNALEEGEKRLETCSEKVSHLQKLYQQQEALLGKFFFKFSLMF